MKFKKQIIETAIVIGLCLVGLQGCFDNNEHDYSQNAPIEGNESDQNPIWSAPHPSHVNNILFAHGYHDDKFAWNTFANYIESEDKYKDWTVYRTSVDPSGAIADRAEELAKYIYKRRDSIKDDSMIVVAHSMGGLDVRYLISRGHTDENTSSIFHVAAKKIHKLYTLASPHRGSTFAGSGVSDAVKDMGIDNMRQFNIDHPYSHFSIDGRPIGFLAMRFGCYKELISDGTGTLGMDGRLSDGTVGTVRQILFGAPHTQSLLRGRHTTKPPNTCEGEKIVETTNIDLLKDILDNKAYYTDQYDIVFYEHNYCKGEENGFYSSTFKRGDIHCKGGDSLCQNDRTSSVKLYPGVAAGVKISLYDSSKGSKSDDWVEIKVLKEIQEPVCIDTLEKSMSTSDINVTYHAHNGLDGKVSMANIDGPYDIALYEDTSCRGDVVTTYILKNRPTVNALCDTGKHCPKNDVVSSMMIYPTTPKHMTIRLYDDPDADMHDDWTRIHIGDTNLSEPFCIKGFEHQTSEREAEKNITVTYYEKNGINGKVSHIKIGSSHQTYGPYDVVAYEEKGCKGDIVAYFDSENSFDGKCGIGKRCAKNDAVSSLLLYPDISKHTTIRLYDDPDANMHDDWTRIHIGDTTLSEPFCITGLEHQTSEREAEKNITVTYYEKNGINGKVSHIKLSESHETYSPYDIVVYEDDDCKGDIVAYYKSDASYSGECGIGKRCAKNDAARSVRFYPGAHKDTTMYLYNDPDGKKDADYVKIILKDDIEESVCVNDISKSHKYKSADVTYYDTEEGCLVNCNVSGHVSYIKVNP